MGSFFFFFFRFLFQNSARTKGVMNITSIFLSFPFFSPYFQLLFPTRERALEFVNRYGSDTVRLLSMGKNRGKGAAVRQGALAARGALILMLDSDGATEISDLTRLEKAVARSDEPDYCIAIGSRKMGVADDHVQGNLDSFFIFFFF
jgi:hypothetical protein